MSEQMGDTRTMAIRDPVVLQTCTSCTGLFDKLYTFWHYLGGVKVCSDCWDKLEAREGDK